MRGSGAGNMKLSLSCFRKESRLAPVKAPGCNSAAEVIFARKWRNKVVSRERPRPYAIALDEGVFFYL